MTPQELQAAIHATDPQFAQLKARVAALQASVKNAKSELTHEAVEAAEAELRVLGPEFGQLSATMETLREIAETMAHAAKVDPAIIYAEAVESRLEIERLRKFKIEGDTEHDISEWREWQDEMAALIDAKSFYWSPTMVSVVNVSSSALPAETIVEAQLFPVKAGWWWFGKDNAHLVLRGSQLRGTNPKRVAAIGWLMRDDGRVHVWAFSGDWPEIGRRQLHTVWNASLELERTVTDISVHEMPEADEMFGLLRFLVAGLLFIRQRVIVTSPTTIGRGPRKRMQRVTQETGLQIVHLRRGELLRGHITERTASGFTCQWWVRGHWRQQPYKEGIRPRWIDPYIKGDPDSPMKQPTEKVFAVVR